jgi:TBC1 domain family protein 5
VLTIARRWIRLLFGREFPLDSVFDMWDALFAIDSTLEMVDMISIAMLLRIRWDLVAADTNEAFALLLRYPELTTPAFTLIQDALYLRDHLTPRGGAEIITRYGKQAPSIEPDSAPSVRVASPSPPAGPRRSRQGIATSRSFVGQQGAGIEALLQGAAKNVLEKGSQWGVGKALRDAVGEVRKNVEAYQSSNVSGQTTPRSGGREYRTPGQPNHRRLDIDRGYSVNAAQRIEELEKRNKNLGRMLESAVGELWEHHREQNERQKTSDDDNGSKEAMETLSLAIAKVQFVQVYLDDSTIPLPVDETTEQAATATAAATLAVPTPLSSERTSSAPPTTHPTPSQSASTATSINKSAPLSPRASSPPAPTPTAKPPAARSLGATSLLAPSRPQLTSSNFSWMLGDESASSNFALGTAHSTFASDEKRRMRGKGFLFGDDDDDEETSSKDGKRHSVGSKGGKSGKSGKGAKGKHAAEAEVEEEVIDLEDVGKRGVI